MLQQSTLQFLSTLKKNNEKTWFDLHRKQYDLAKEDMLHLAGALLKAISHFDPSIAHIQAKDCLFRINRDVRFSKNKAPYKTNMAIYISSGGKKALDVAGYYVHIEPGASFMAGGIWMPMAPELKKIRQEIDYNFAEFHQVVSQKKFSSLFGDLERGEGTQLSRPPKGYDASNEAIEWLKLKSFIASVALPDALLTDKKLESTLGKNFETLFPLIQFLNRALEHE